MTDIKSSLSVLTFRAGTLHADFPDCIKQPGIYGTIISPIELLDSLLIMSGVNANSVRFAGQFQINQEILENRLEEGMIVGLTKKLELYYR